MIFVAEIGSNHKGIKALAYEMIRQFSAVNPGGIIKFQLGHDPEDPIRYIDHWVEDLAQWCDDFGVEFMASIWTLEALELARSVNMKRYKIAHQLKNEHDFIIDILSDKKETFISNGRWDGGRNIFCDERYPSYGLSEYFPDKFSSIGTSAATWYGYSSHMHGIADALIAISRGAKYIEKHVTLDKTEESIRDNAFAISPQEFATMVQLGKEIARIV